MTDIRDVEGFDSDEGGGGGGAAVDMDTHLLKREYARHHDANQTLSLRFF
jgi:hypothetical protein